MCGRATLTSPELETVAQLVEATFDPAHTEAYRPRYNLAPGDRHWIVRRSQHQRRLEPAHWGLRGRIRPLIINIRAESAATRFSSAFLHRRCLVPVDGFYEWMGGKGRRHPIWFHPRSESLLLLAGLYEERTDGGFAFGVLTSAPNTQVAKVHDRMPVILPPERADEWLSAPAACLLAPAPEELLLATAVTDRVNSVAHDDPDCLAPALPQKGQLPLL